MQFISNVKCIFDVAIWWTPLLSVVRAALWGGRLRFETVMSIGRTLMAIGLPATASRVYSVEISRAERTRQS